MAYKLLNSNIFLIVFLFPPFLSFSQHQINGFVLNSKNEALAYANIRVYDTTETKMIKYAISDDTGSYSINLNAGNYLFKVNFLGYKAIAKRKYIHKNETINFKLFEEDKELHEIVIESRALGASICNDTTKYNLKNLTTGKEENLKDVLNKLPGVEINANGKIEANGKQIDKLLIDGKEFFGDQHQLATENISSEMVQGISLFENFNDFSDLENQKKSGKTAMNIEIDENYKGKIKGNTTVGGGYQDKYELNTNLYSFKNKLNLFFIGSTNNIGNQTFTFEDYIGFQGGIQKILSDNASSTILSGDDLPSYLLADNNVKTKKEQFSAFNLSYNPSTKFKLNSYIIFDRTNINEKQFIKQIYTHENQNITLDLDKNKYNTFWVNNSFVNAIYKPSNKTVFEYLIDFSPQKNDLKSNDNFSLKKYKSEREINNFSLNQALKFKSRIDRFILSSTLYHSLKKRNENLSIISNDIFLSLLFPKDVFEALQNVNNQNENYGLNTFVSTKIVKKLFVKLKYNLSKINETFRSNVENNPQHNKTKLNILENKLGINFYNRGKPFLNYDAGCDVSFLKSNEYKKIYFLPFANLKFNFSRSHYLSLSYKRTLNLPQAENIITDSYISNYNTLINNQNIMPNTIAKYDNFRLNYLINDLYSGTFLGLGASHIIGKDIIATNTILSSDYLINRFVVGDFDSKTNAFFILNKKWGKIPFNFKLNTSFSYVNSHNYLNAKPNKYTYNILSNRLSFVSNFRKGIFNFEFGYENKQSRLSSNAIDTESKLYLHRPFINLFFDYQNFSLSVNGAIDFYETNFLETKFYTLSPLLYCKTNNKRWKFYIKGHDIFNLNKNYVIENIAYDNYFEEKTISTIGGFFIVGLVYKF